MLEKLERTVSEGNLTIGEVQSPGELFVAFRDMVRRHFRLILFATLFTIGLAGVYVITTPPSFTAQTTLIIDARKVLPLLGQSSYMDQVPPDSAAVESQVEILKSQKIARSVIERLHLTEDPDLVGHGGGLFGLIGSVSDWFVPPGPKSQSVIEQRAAKTFSDRLDVKRVGLSYIIEVSFRASDPNRAAEIANATADAYMADQLDAKSAGATREAQWLQDRIGQLENQASDAERAVVDFKTHRSQLDNQAQIALKGLEGTAETYRALHDKFVQRYMEQAQQESFPISEARVITAASPPLTKSHPKTLLILAISTLAGLIIGLGLAQLREFLDRGFRTRKQVESRLHAECIAIVPALPASRAPLEQKSSSTGKAATIGAPRTIECEHTLARHVIDFPFSRFTEAIRSIRLASSLIEARRPNRTIGITSTLPSEGKSTIAVSLAQLMAQGGSRPVLVDCDLRNPSLTRLLAPEARSGLFNLVVGDALLEDVVWTDPTSGLAFLPQAMKTRTAYTTEALGSEVMRRIFDQLRERYDYVIADLPPVAPIVDVRATTHIIDSYVYVVEWGQKFDVVDHGLRGAAGVYEKLLGVVLNKVDIAALGAYDGSGYYNEKSYSKYGLTS